MNNIRNRIQSHKLLSLGAEFESLFDRLEAESTRLPGALLTDRSGEIGGHRRAVLRLIESYLQIQDGGEQ